MARNKAAENKGCLLIVGGIMVFGLTSLICNSIGGWVQKFIPFFIITAELIFITALSAFFSRDQK